MDRWDKSMVPHQGGCVLPGASVALRLQPDANRGEKHWDMDGRKTDGVI